MLSHFVIHLFYLLRVPFNRIALFVSPCSPCQVGYWIYEQSTLPLFAVRATTTANGFTGTVLIGTDNTADIYPLEPSEYAAFLVIAKHGNDDDVVFINSSTFFVQPEGEACIHSP